MTPFDGKPTKAGVPVLTDLHLKYPRLTITLCDECDWGEYDETGKCNFCAHIRDKPVIAPGKLLSAKTLKRVARR